MLPSRRRRPGRPLPVRLALAPLVLALIGTTPMRAHAASPGPGRTFAVIINGGGSADDNFHSHLLHLREMTTMLLAAGIPRERIRIFASDGPNPDPDVAVLKPDPDGFWLLEGTGLDRLLGEPIRYEDTRIEGMTVQPASRGALARYWDEARTELRAGDTLLFYVTDHGKDDPRDSRDNRIVLWGREGLSARQLGADLARLPAGVRVVALMSQCFSGGFAHLLDVRAQDGLPSGAVCGYFASTADRPAFGCYPEASHDDRVGHSFAMIDGLAATGHLTSAHADTLLRDQSPDVPLRTSDSYLADRLKAAAATSGVEVDAFTDHWLAEARRIGHAPELGLADSLARAYGLERVMTLAAVGPALREVRGLADSLDRNGKLWDAALVDTTRATEQRFMKSHPAWTPRLRPQIVRRLQDGQRQELSRALITELSAFVDASPPDRERLDRLTDKADAASALGYRMEVREAALLRLRILLTSAAARAYLDKHGTAAQRTALAAIERCEDFTLPRASGAKLPMPAPYPPLDSDRRQAGEVTPSWLGIAFEPVTAPVRARLHLTDGAALVTGVLPGSPADGAGVVAGDIVTGAAGMVFDRPNQIRSWAMLSPAGTRVQLESIRRGTPHAVELTLAHHPGH